MVVYFQEFEYKDVMTQATLSNSESLNRRYGLTKRLDRWWIEPLLTGGGLLTFVIY